MLHIFPWLAVDNDVKSCTYGILYPPLSSHPHKQLSQEVLRWSNKTGLFYIHDDCSWLLYCFYMLVISVTNVLHYPYYSAVFLLFLPATFYMSFLIKQTKKNSWSYQLCCILFCLFSLEKEIDRKQVWLSWLCCFSLSYVFMLGLSEITCFTGTMICPEFCIIISLEHLFLIKKKHFSLF